VLESPFRIVARLPRTVRLLVAGTFVNRLGTLIVPYLTLVLRRELGLSPAVVGAIVFMYGVGTLGSILVGGFLTDRLGRRRVLVTSLLGGGLAAVALGASHAASMFVPLLVLFGFLSEMYRPASSAIIADLLPSSSRAVGFAALRMAANLGFAVGVALGGLVADRSWRWLFFGDGATTMLFGVVVLLFIPETRPAAPAGSVRPDRSPARSLSPWRDVAFMQLLLSSLILSMALLANFTVLPLTITLSAGYPAAVYGLLMGLNGLLIAFLEVSIVGWLTHLRRLRVAAVGVLLAGLGFGLNGVAPHWLAFLAAVLVWTAGEILALPQQMAFVADWSPPEARGTYLSLFTATFSLAWALNPVLLLPLHAWLGDGPFWLLMIVVTSPAALLLLRLDRTADHPEKLRGLV